MPDWIERIFGLAPDGGDGSAEWGLAISRQSRRSRSSRMRVACDRREHPHRLSKRNTGSSAMPDDAVRRNCHSWPVFLRGSVMKSSDHDRRHKPEPSTPTEPAGGGQGSVDNPYRPPTQQPMTGCDCDQIICLLDKICAERHASPPTRCIGNGMALKVDRRIDSGARRDVSHGEPRCCAGLRPPCEVARAS